MRRRSVSREEGQQWAVGLDARREGVLLLHHRRRDGEGMQGVSERPVGCAGLECAGTWSCATGFSLEEAARLRRSPLALSRGDEL